MEKFVTLGNSKRKSLNLKNQGLEREIQNVGESYERIVRA